MVNTIKIDLYKDASYRVHKTSYARNPPPPPPKDIMEQKVQSIVDAYFADFREYMKNCAQTDDERNEISQKIDAFPPLILKHADFYVKKEAPIVEEKDRCVAKRADNTQCTRRKKKGCELCGTHVKGTPYGLIELNDGRKKEIVVQVKEVKGIPYYVDADNRVYNTEDVLESRENPRIVGKYITETNSIEIF